MPSEACDLGIGASAEGKAVASVTAKKPAPVVDKRPGGRGGRAAGLKPCAQTAIWLQ